MKAAPKFKKRDRVAVTNWTEHEEAEAHHRLFSNKAGIIDYRGYEGGRYYYRIWWDTTNANTFKECFLELEHVFYSPLMQELK